MFPNLRAEMARLGITTEAMASKIGKSKEWLENRFNGKCSLPINIAFKIKEECFPEIQFEYLFKQTAIIPFCEIDLPKTENE